MENDQEKPTVSSPTCTALLCCPFCGSEAYDCPDNSYGDGIIGCSQCEPEPTIAYMAGNKIEHEKAIKAWNKRAS
tara:strand:+ start:12224 stop:12448 length:225 start_codon:yes stop_codon:yes gene_type:complete